MKRNDKLQQPMEKINLKQKFSLFDEHWSPKIVGEPNGQHVKLAKLKGEFTWHKHDNEDELFFVMKGSLKIEFRDKTIALNENELLIVPKGKEHRPVADEEVWIMLFEPASTLNTGNTENEFTRRELDRI
jgi:mannose-6-phosphate isomerase-like protein (cupin superfamily)